MSRPESWNIGDLYGPLAAIEARIEEIANRLLEIKLALDTLAAIGAALLAERETVERETVEHLAKHAYPDSPA